MSYDIITGNLVTRTALHIGAGEDSETTDALLRRDAQGRLLIPGTALAGALRTIATRLAPRIGCKPCWALWPENHAHRPKDRPCACAVCFLFGDVNPQEQEEAGEASRLWVADAPVVSHGQETQIRDGVGIERRDRVAARSGAAKFDLEVLPPGAVFAFRLEWYTPLDGLPELQQAHLSAEHLLAAALAEWEQGRGGLGGRVGRGLGAFRLEALQRAQCDLNDGATLMAFLREEIPWQCATPVAGWLATRLHEARQALKPADDEHKELAIAGSWLEVGYILEADGPLLVNDPVAQAQSGFDHAPLLVGFLKPDQDGQPLPILPGAGLRGALRSQAERIARTVATLEAWQQPEAQRQDHFATHCPACDPNARRKREPGSPAVPLESCDSLLHHKAVGSDEEIQKQDLCLACWLFGSARQGSRLVVEDARFVGQEPVYKPRDFLAIDRFTGGGAEHYKFDAIELWQPRFEARLRLENPQAWELGWLFLTLRDLQDGLIPLGFGIAKGMGHVHVTQWTARLGFLHLGDVPGGLPAGITTTASGLYQVAETSWAPASPPTAWGAQAEGWVQAFREQVRDFRRQNRLPPMAIDTYFGHSQLMQLYPAQVKTHEDARF